MSDDPEDGGTDGNGEGGNDGNGESDTGNGGQSAQTEEPSTAEKAVMVISVAFTLLLFGYAAWQLATPARADAPRVTVVGTEPLPNGSVAVTVELRNPMDVGLVTATVESDCTSPPAEVQFSYVPASTRRTGTLVCPAGTTDPSVSMANWVSQ